MQPVTKRYMALLSIVGIGVGIYVVWSWLFRQRQNWSPHELGVLVVLTVLCILCRCLPLYVRDDCTIDMSFISILAVVLLLGPEAAVAIIFLTTPLEVIPTEDGKGFYHIFNTAPSKLLFNTANLNLSMAAAGVSIVTGSPFSRILPSYPPVPLMTDMPKRMFISVDFPAPFSPTSAWMVPGITSSDTPLRTLLP